MIISQKAYYGTYPAKHRGPRLRRLTRRPRSVTRYFVGLRYTVRATRAV